MELTHEASAVVDRTRQLQHDLDIKGKFVVEHYDINGNLKATYNIENGIKNAGKDMLLNVMFHGTSPISTWYVGLINASGWTAESASDTLASHSGWTEYTSYTGNRIEWTEGATASGSITNSTSLNYAITVDGTLKGVFLASVASGTSGTLWSTADFPSPIAVVNGETFKITYTVSL